MFKRSRFPVNIPFLVGMLLVGIGIWQHQFLSDRINLYSYDVPDPVAQLARETTMSSGSTRVFYVNHPAIQDRDAFNVSCSSRGEQTIVLGCYHPVDRGIFVYHVSDDRLTGVDQVTAAHELLHAEYDRLSKKERTHINGLLEDFYKNKLTDDRIKAVVASYQKTEPNDVPNEMHSVFGTEVGQLTPELETYYKQYFTNRATVVAYANTYQQEFSSRQTRVTLYDSQLKALKQQIDDNNASLDSQEKSITTLKSQMDAQRSSGEIIAYNANVPIFNAKIETYNALITKVRTQIANYNATVNVRNDVAGQVTELAHSIDSSYQSLK